MSRAKADKPNKQLLMVMGELRKRFACYDAMQYLWTQRTCQEAWRNCPEVSWFEFALEQVCGVLDNERLMRKVVNVNLEVIMTAGRRARPRGELARALIRDYTAGATARTLVRAYWDKVDACMHLPYDGYDRVSYTIVENFDTYVVQDLGGFVYPNQLPVYGARTPQKLENLKKLIIQTILKHFPHPPKLKC